MADARETALSLLLKRETTRADITELLKDALAEAGASLSVRDRALVKRLTVGTVERQITLDAVVDRIASVKTKAMKVPVRVSIRMGAYQILFLDAVPDAAAVDEAVKLVRGHVPVKLAGFVNAVLRRIAREKEMILARLASPDTPLAERYAMPSYLCKLFLRERGAAQTERIFASFFDSRRLCLRPDPRLLADRGRYDAWERALIDKTGGVKHHPAIPDLLLIDAPSDVRTLPGYAEGAFFVQDAAGAIAVAAAGIGPGDRVLDVCAAPGGKAICAAAMLNDPAQLVARDISEEKCALIAENAARMRLSGMQIEQRDAAVFDPASEGRFDVVLCDLPCTGFGVIGRKPEIKYHASSQRTDALVALQREILHVAARYVKPGGTLIYSTCTVSRAENEENVAWLLSEFPFAPEPWLAAAVAGAVRANVREGCLQLLPGEHETDGFFIARLRRQK